MSMAATLTTEEVSQTIDSHDPGVFMHGPTFMANPLACAVSMASISLLLESGWAARVSKISAILESRLSACRGLDNVEDVRVLGAIGVIELDKPVDMASITASFVEQGVWIRPFGKLVYLMPPYIIGESDLNNLCDAVCQIVEELN